MRHVGLQSDCAEADLWIMDETLAAASVRRQIPGTSLLQAFNDGLQSTIEADRRVLSRR